jgi:hypothetical protein
MTSYQIHHVLLLQENSEELQIFNILVTLDLARSRLLKLQNEFGLLKG